MKIVFMGTPDFAILSLENLVNEGYSVPLVVTQKDRRRGRGKKLRPTPVKAKAEELGLDVYQPNDVNSDESVKLFKEISPDVIVVAAYGQILKKEILSIPKYGCINIHASLLPKYRGAAPINWAIINGEDKTGITIMEMEEKLDAGPMLLQETIEIGEEDDAQMIHDSLKKLGSQLIIDVLRNLEKGNVNKIPQDEEKSIYAPMLHKKIGEINWNDKAIDIKNKIRGLKPWPCAYTYYKGKNMKIHKVDIVEKFEDSENGKVVKVSDEGIYVNCNDDCIVIEEFQLPGKKKLLVEEYLRGNKFESGVILG